MKKLFLFLLPFAALFITPANDVSFAQNTTCATRPLGDSSNACASTAFTKNTAQAVSILTYGAKIDGVTDDTPAFQLAVSAICSTGGTIFIPAGVTIMEGATTGSCSNIQVKGAGVGATVVAAKSRTSNVFTFGDGVASRFNLSLTDILVSGHTAGGVGDATAGSLVTVNGINTFIMTDYALWNWSTALTFTDQAHTAVAIAHNGLIQNGWNAAAPAVNISGGTDIYISNTTISCGLSGGQGSLAAILLTQSGGTLLQGGDTIQCGYGLLIQPSGGQSVFATSINHFQFDTAPHNAIYFFPQDTSKIIATSITDTWASSSNESGIRFNAPGTATIDGVTIGNSRVYNNGSAGLQIDAGTNIKVTGSLIIGNNWSDLGAAVELNGTIQHVSIIGNRIGPSTAAAGFNSPSSYGVFLQAVNTMDYITVLNNDTSLNTLGGVLNSTTGGGTHNYIASNSGSTSPQDPLANPMTTAGDIIYGGVSGVATRLPVGTSAQVLYSGTTPSWGSSVTTINSVACNLGSTCTITAVADAGALTGTTLAANVVSSSLASVGTIGTGTWQGTVLAGQYGGTGIANTGKTITLGASLTTTGAGTATLAFPASPFTYTFPGASQTLASLAGTEALSNKDLTSGTNTFPTLNQNTTGSAAKWTTARNLAGNSVDGSANVTFANKFIVQGTTDAGLSAAQFLGALGTGLVKNTTTTGVLSIATAGTDYLTSVGASFTGGLISIGSSPLTANGTLAFTVAGTSGGIPYFASTSTWASSALLASNAIMLGGGAGNPPATTTTGTGVVTAIGNAVSGSGSLCLTTSCVMVTPTIGAATATSVNKVALTAPASSATLTIADGTTLTETTSTSVGKGQYLATATNDDATAGNIGELLSTSVASGAAISLTSGQTPNLTSQLLTAGDWDVSCEVFFVPANGTVVQTLGAYLSQTTGTAPTLAAFNGAQQVYGAGITSTGTTSISVQPGPLRVSLASSTTEYCVVFTQFTTNTLAMFGGIQARRVR